MTAHLYKKILSEMDLALDALTQFIPPPRAVAFKDSFVYRHIEQLPHQAIVQKLARLTSSLRATNLLLESGFFQEQGALQRVLDELVEDIIFLSIPIIYGGDESKQILYLQAFFAEEFDPDTGLPVAQDRPTLPRKKIRAFIANSPVGTSDPSSHVDTSKIISKAYSGYVHAASPQIMDMYLGTPPRFMTNGMLGTHRETGHRQDISNYYHRSLTAFAIASRALGHHSLFDQLFALCNQYEAAMGMK